jgi:hypothetical protein
MTGNFAISLAGRLAQVGRLRSCVLASVSETAAPDQRPQIGGKLHPNPDLSGEPGHHSKPPPEIEKQIAG